MTFHNLVWKSLHLFNDVSSCRSIAEGQKYRKFKGLACLSNALWKCCCYTSLPPPLCKSFQFACRLVPYHRLFAAPLRSCQIVYAFVYLSSLRNVARPWQPKPPPPIIAFPLFTSYFAASNIELYTVMCISSHSTTVIMNSIRVVWMVGTPTYYLTLAPPWPIFSLYCPPPPSNVRNSIANRLRRIFYPVRLLFLPISHIHRLYYCPEYLARTTIANPLGRLITFLISVISALLIP